MSISHIVNSSTSPPVYSARQAEVLRLSTQALDTANFSAQSRRLALADQRTVGVVKTAESENKKPKILGEEHTLSPHNETSVKSSIENNTGDKPAEAEKFNNEARQNDQFSSELTESERLEVEKLKSRDAEVKAHEQAHLSAAGDLAQGGASFDYETGPDNKRYAVGGEVNIDTSAVSGDPQATLNKAQRIRRAASAPADPSPQDRSVAAQASRMEVQARVDISQQIRETQAQYVADNTPEHDFLSPQQDQNDKNVQDTYKRIQNASVLEQNSFIDFFI